MTYRTLEKVIVEGQRKGNLYGSTLEAEGSNNPTGQDGAMGE